jgi:hypothetical protein
MTVPRAMTRRIFFMDILSVPLRRAIARVAALRQNLIAAQDIASLVLATPARAVHALFRAGSASMPPLRGRAAGLFLE